MNTKAGGATSGEGSSSSSSSSKTSAESGAEASGDGAEDVCVDMLRYERETRESRGRVVSPVNSPGVLPGLEQMWCESAKDLPRNLKVGCSCSRDWQCKSRSCPHEDGEPWHCAAQQEGSSSEENLVGGAQPPTPSTNAGEQGGADGKEGGEGGEDADVLSEHCDI